MLNKKRRLNYRNPQNEMNAFQYLASPDLSGSNWALTDEPLINELARIGVEELTPETPEEKETEKYDSEN